MPQCCAYNCTKPGTFYFPKDDIKKQRWIVAVKREHFQPSAHSRLCRDHFLPEDFIQVENPQHGTFSTKLKEDAVPSKFVFSKPQSQSTQSRRKRGAARKKLLVSEGCATTALDLGSEGTQLAYVEEDECGDFACEMFVCDSAEDTPDVVTSGPNETLSAEVVDIEMNETEGESRVEMNETDGESRGLKRNANEDKLKEDHSNSEHAVPCTCCKKCSNAHKARFVMTLDDFADDDKGVHYYTGLESFENCMLVFYTLCPEAYELVYKHSQVVNVKVKDQFFMTLMKLRRCTPDYELSRLFHCSKSVVSNVVTTWIYFMAEMWSLIDTWPEKDLVEYFMPQSFKKKHGSTRVIVDGTEIPISKPCNARAQQSAFSHYKNRCTLKVMVGATPGGLLSFCSEAFGGSTSDRAITERCGLLEKCEQGDTIMADRGFIVSDLCANKGIGLNIPSFMKNRNQLPSHTVLADRDTASKRVHIERLINLVKTYKMLKYELDKAYVSMGSEIIAVCVMLGNFRPNVVEKKR